MFSSFSEEALANAIDEMERNLLQRCDDYFSESGIQLDVVQVSSALTIHCSS